MNALNYKNRIKNILALWFVCKDIEKKNTNYLKSKSVVYHCEVEML
jgi:hypothetical protein